MKKCWLFMAIITLTASFVMVPKGTIGFFDLKNAIGATGDGQVELYVTSSCPYCQKAMAYLKSKGIPFQAYNIERDADAASRKKKMDTQGGVPFAVINGKKISGFSEEAYQKALGVPGAAQEKARQEKLDKQQSKTGKKPKSWQVLNR